MDVNQALVRGLESIGVGHVFGGSGQVNASMLLALRDSEKIRTIIVRNEQAASFMACGYGMYSDNLGVCFATGGPGAFNLFSGMAVAYSDSLPVLGITGYVSASMRGKGALNESSGLNRTPDSHSMFQATTKKSYLIEHPDQTCDILEDAVNTAFEGRPGPVHIHIPKDVTGAPVSNFRDITLDVKPVLPPPEVVSAFASRLATAIETGEKTVLLIGYGAVRSHAEAEVKSFVQRFQIPFATTMDAKGIVPEDHPLCLGVFGGSGDPGANAYFGEAGLVLALGNSFAQNATFAYQSDLFAGKTLMHINIDPVEIGKVYRADFEMVSDIKPAIAAISELLDGKVGPVPELHVPKARWFDSLTEASGARIHPAELTRAISRNLPPEAIVLGDAGSDMLWLNCYLNLSGNQRFQNPGSFGPMASQVNGAMGVKCANPGKPVVCGCGDGAYLMGGFELLTAVQYDIPVVWVVYNNGEFNIIKKFLIDMLGDHAFMTFGNPDYVSYAAACGALGFRAETLEQFEKDFVWALESRKPVLIDVPVDSEVYPPFALGRV